MEVNTMRKLLIVMVVLVAVGFIGSQALACLWDGYWGGPMRGSWGGYYSNPGGSHQEFLNDTAPLRQELAAKQGEYNALMAQPNPDPKRVGQLSQEIAHIHDRLQAKAQASGLPRPGSYGAPMGGYGYGPGHGGWACW
jgi:zinc resistance-associated protein